MFFNNNIYSLKIFNGLTKEIIDKIVENCEIREYSQWKIIVVEWEKSNWEWYIIKRWRVSISIWWKKIVEMNPWDIFWEIALLNEETRTATASADTDIEVIVLKFDNMIELIDNDKNWLNKTILKRIEENIERE
jgi:CRP-like cAMP-binding protein